MKTRPSAWGQVVSYDDASRVSWGCVTASKNSCGMKRVYVHARLCMRVRVCVYLPFPPYLWNPDFPDS